MKGTDLNCQRLTIEDYLELKTTRQKWVKTCRKLLF